MLHQTIPACDSPRWSMARRSPSERANMDDNTIITRPLPKRPETGLQAWLATIGYLGTEYSPDAMLTLRAVPNGSGAFLWSGAASWGQIGRAACRERA